MSWLKRGKRLYLYLARWEGGKRRNIYIGPEGSLAATLAVEAERLRQAAAEANRARIAELDARWQSIQQQLKILAAHVDRMITVVMLLHGYYQSDRHAWKERRAS